MLIKSPALRQRELLDRAHVCRQLAAHSPTTHASSELEKLAARYEASAAQALGGDQSRR
jgi:hypothetical protein